MCGRFGLTRPDKLDLQRFGVRGFPAQPPRYNIPPGSHVLAVRQVKGERRADLIRWGLVPSWAASTSVGNRMANARSDTALTRPSFRMAMQKRRCLIPADVFYEWQAVPGQRRKLPWALALESRDIFALGGIWEYWRAPGEDEGIVSCAVLTTAPNELLEPIHDRMPVLVPPGHYDDWLSASTPMGRVAEITHPVPSEWLQAWRVSLAVNDPANDNQSVLESAPA